jgi:TctA family transporter
MEDEPAGLYRQAAAAGIMPGSRLTVLEKGADFLRLAVEDRVCELPLAVALATFAICVAATLYPAWRAAQIAPVEALRYE